MLVIVQVVLIGFVAVVLAFLVVVRAGRPKSLYLLSTTHLSSLFLSVFP